MKNIIAYNVNIGEYDNHIDINIPGIMSMNITEVKMMADLPAKMSRHPKIMYDEYLPEHNFNFYLDGNIRIGTFDIQKAIQRMGSADMILFRHPSRNCLFDEAGACIRRKKDDTGKIVKQMQRYRRERFPEHRGLYACGMMLRKNNNPMREFMKYWWDEITAGSYRDQISFPYVLWKHPIIRVKTIPFMQGFKIVKHLRK